MNFRHRDQNECHFRSKSITPIQLCPVHGGPELNRKFGLPRDNLTLSEFRVHLYARALMKDARNDQ
jgi:hypothetical protein